MSNTLGRAACATPRTRGRSKAARPIRRPKTAIRRPCETRSPGQQLDQEQAEPGPPRRPGTAFWAWRSEFSSDFGVWRSLFRIMQCLGLARSRGPAGPAGGRAFRVWRSRCREPELQCAEGGVNDTDLLRLQVLGPNAAGRASRGLGWVGAIEAGDLALASREGHRSVRVRGAYSTVGGLRAQGQLVVGVHRVRRNCVDPDQRGGSFLGVVSWRYRTLPATAVSVRQRTSSGATARRPARRAGR